MNINEKFRLYWKLAKVSTASVGILVAVGFGLKSSLSIALSLPLGLLLGGLSAAVLFVTSIYMWQVVDR